MTALVLTEEERLAVAALLGHALDVAHEDVERDYLQRVCASDEEATEEREDELEALLGGVLDRLAKEVALPLMDANSDNPLEAAIARDRRRRHVL